MDVNDLEGALNAAKDSGENAGQSKEDVVSAESEIGFHRGALNVLVAERAELVKMLGNVEGIAGAHVKRLKELGVDVK